jgi:hypothetical protein
MGRMVLA